MKGYKFRGKRQPSGQLGKAISCERKIRYDKDQAKRVAEITDYDYKGDGRHMRAYKCKFAPKQSPHWHVGREPAKATNNKGYSLA